MLSIFDRRRRVGRRELLQVGSLALGGLSVSSLLPRLARGEYDNNILRDKSVVLLVLQGGPPQIETFDPKLGGPDYSRSVTGEVQTSIPGVSYGGTFSKLAKLAHKLAVVRSFGAGQGGLSHEAGYEKLLSGGHELPEPPMHALFARAAGSINLQTGVPTNSIILPETIDPDIKLGGPSGAFTYNQTKRYFATAGRLGPQYEPFDPSGGGQLLNNLEMQLPPGRFDDRRQLLMQLDGFRRQLDRMRLVDDFRQQAYNVLLKGISQAFDLSQESPATLEQYDTSDLVPLRKIRRGGPLYWNNFNRTTNLLGKQMLLARRLCEAGCGFVTVIDSCWDFHDDGNNPPVKIGMDVLSPQLDHAVSAFLQDVEARGLSDKILLIITAEMGRSPKKGGKSGGGSGHWGDLTPLVIAGGGLNMGQTIGSSDRKGAFPATDPYRPEHLLSTVMHTLFDIGELRIQPDLPTDLVERMTTSPPIRELV